MDTVSLLSKQLHAAHIDLEKSVDGLTKEQAVYLPPGSGGSIAATYARVLILEDAFVNGLLRGGQPLFAGDWNNRVGVSDSMPLPAGIWPDFSGPDWPEYDAWARSVRASLPMLRKYGQAVYASSDQYLASLSPDDLARSYDIPSLGLSSATVDWIVSRLLIGHADAMRGEIRSLKQMQATTSLG